MPADPAYGSPHVHLGGSAGRSGRSLVPPSPPSRGGASLPRRSPPDAVCIKRTIATTAGIADGSTRQDCASDARTRPVRGRSGPLRPPVNPPGLRARSDRAFSALPCCVRASDAQTRPARCQFGDEVGSARTWPGRSSRRIPPRACRLSLPGPLRSGAGRSRPGWPVPMRSAPAGGSRRFGWPHRRGWRCPGRPAGRCRHRSRPARRPGHA